MAGERMTDREKIRFEILQAYARGEDGSGLGPRLIKAGYSNELCIEVLESITDEEFFQAAEEYDKIHPNEMNIPKSGDGPTGQLSEDIDACVEDLKHGYELPREEQPAFARELTKKYTGETILRAALKWQPLAALMALKDTREMFKNGQQA
jgi:hypothetical protein